METQTATEQGRYRACMRAGCGDFTDDPSGFCSRVCRRMYTEAAALHAPLKDGSWPIPWATLWPSEVGKHRVIWCRRYDRCLEHAAVAGWSGFSCRRCDVDDVVSRAEQVAELKRILECATDLIHETELVRRPR